MSGVRKILDVGALPWMPRVEIALVDAVDLSAALDPDVGMGQQELSGFGLEREAVRALPGRVHERRRRAVHHVARRDLVGAGTERRGTRRNPSATRAQREDGADGAIDVEVRRPVDGIAADDERIGALRGHLDRLLGLLGDEGRAGAGGPERGLDDLVPPDVELLDLVAGHVDPADVAQPVPERGVRQLLGDDGGDAADPAHHRGHAASMRTPGLLLGCEMLGQRDRRHAVPLQRANCRIWKS